MSYDSWHPMQTQLEASGMMLVPVQTNLIDVIWDDRPAPPCNIIQPHALKYSGDFAQSVLLRNLNLYVLPNISHSFVNSSLRQN